MYSKKQPPEMFYKKGVLKNFTKFTGKQLCQILFLIKLQGFIKKETLEQVLSCGICKIFENPFFTEQLRKTASAFFRSINVLVLIVMTS